MINFRKSNIGKDNTIIYYLIFFVVIFISDDTFNFGTNENEVFILTKYFFYLSLTGYLLKKSSLTSLIKLTRISLIFYLISFAVIATMLLNLEFSGGYIYQVWLFLLGGLIVRFIPNKEFINIFSKFIYVLSIISVFVYMVANTIPSLIMIFPYQINSADAHVHNLFVCMVSFENEYVRNMSIFREPGVYMIYLNLAIIFELFFKEKLNKKYLIVFIIAVFTTLSTAAFIILATIFFAYLFVRNVTLETVKNKSYILLIIIIGLIILIASDELFRMVFDKIGKDNIADGSSLARGVSVLANLNIFLDNIIYGVGIKSYPVEFERNTLELMGLALDVGNNTNTITTIFAVYGLLLGCIFIYLVITFVRKASKLVIVQAFLFLVFIMLYSNEYLRYSLMSATLLMWGLSRQNNISLNKEIVKAKV